MRAPEFPKDVQWLNTERPLSLSMLKGHVVLLDFWTYCCINCLHVLPDLSWLEEKHHDEPFVVIGVHTAKFDNEKDADNIRHAIQRYEIGHPVVVDNHRRIWESYTVKAWPSFVVIDPDGRIIGMTSGEGKRDILDDWVKQGLTEGRRRGSIAKEKIDIHVSTQPKHVLSFPGKLAHNPENGRLFISDTNHHRILEIEKTGRASASITRIIGSGKAGREDGSFSTSSFFRPQGLAYRAEKLYVCDTDNHLIREVNLTTETVCTLGGTGEQGWYGEKGGPALETRLNSPWDVVAQDDGLYIAMAGPHQLWRFDYSTGVVDVFAGSGQENIWDGVADEALLAQPSGIDADEEWLYFADSETSALRKARRKDGNVVTLVGSGLFDFGLQDGPFSMAQLQHPLGVAYHGRKVYVADTYNHAIRVAYLEEGYMETLIGRPKKTTCTIEGEECSALPLNEPNDVLVVGSTLYVADTNNHLIRLVDLRTKELHTLYIE